MSELRCIHRHSILEHPKCFIKGLIRPQKAEAPKVEVPRYVPWYENEKIKVGYLDIETSGLNPDFGLMLTWCIKPRGGSEIVHDCVAKDELFALKFDERIVKSCVEEMKKYDVIVTYYGTRFDNTYLRAKALRYGIDFPGYQEITTYTKLGKEVNKIHPEVFHFDLYFLVRAKLASLSRRSLDNVCDFLGIEGKTEISKNAWRSALYGDPKALHYVLEHNKGDVVILEQLHNKLAGFSKWTRNSI